MVHAMVHLAAGSMSFSAPTMEELLSTLARVVPTGGDIHLALRYIDITTDDDPFTNPAYRLVLQDIFADDPETLERVLSKLA